MKKYRTYSEEFKRTLIAQLDNGELSLAAAARENQISPSLLERWRKQIHEGTLILHPSKREKQLERELDRYKKKVGELTVLVDLLKKTSEVSTYTRRSNGFIVTGKKPDQSERGAK